MLDTLHDERFCDQAPASVWATLLDESSYLASVSTMYRQLRERGETGDRRRHATHPARVKPEPVATHPNHVWSWDITKFRVRWAAHNVRIHTSGVKRLHHPVVGDLELAFESFPLAADPSQSLLTYTAEPGSPSQNALRLLASWAATTDDVEQPASTDDSQQAEWSRHLTDQVNVDKPQRATAPRPCPGSTRPTNEEHRATPQQRRAGHARPRRPHRW